jgi:hypothetical protein
MGGISYRWAFSVSVFFRERVMIEAPYRRAFVPTIGGDIWGPRLQGTVVLTGARTGGGGGPLDAHYMFEASDGHQIYINNRGYMRRVGWDPTVALDRRLPPREPGVPLNQDFTAPPDNEASLRMRTSPFFDARPTHSLHDWLNHTLIIGHGLRRTDPDRTVFTYYEVL